MHEAAEEARREFEHDGRTDDLSDPGVLCTVRRVRVRLGTAGEVTNHVREGFLKSIRLDSVGLPVGIQYREAKYHLLPAGYDRSLSHHGETAGAPAMKSR